MEFTVDRGWYLVPRHMQNVKVDGIGTDMEEQRAISRYFDEDDLDKNSKDHATNDKSRAQMLLRPQYWKGQQHGGSSAEIHARHLRPLCEMVSSSTSGD